VGGRTIAALWPCGTVADTRAPSTTGVHVLPAGPSNGARDASAIHWNGVRSMKKFATLAAAGTLAAAALIGTMTIPAAVAAPATSHAKPSHKPSPTPTTSPTPTATPTPTPTASDSSTLPTPDHVVIAMFENEDSTAIASSPTFSAWAKEGALLTDSHGITHPSEPNYLALWSGSTQGVTDDSCPHTFTTANLGQQLIASGRSTSIYSERLPAAGSTTCNAGTSPHTYARRHNPLADWTQTADAAHNLPWTSFPSDYSTLPTVSMVVPDTCDDMHDCSVSTGDAWLANNLQSYKDWAMTHNSVLIVTFDEDSSSTTANKIYTFLDGQHIRPGSTYASRVTHYGVLHTIEQAYGLTELGTSEAPITGIYQ
jgi:phosphatidylinositol-3-phosphatase